MYHATIQRTWTDTKIHKHYLRVNLFLQTWCGLKDICPTLPHHACDFQGYHLPNFDFIFPPTFSHAIFLPLFQGGSVLILHLQFFSSFMGEEEKQEKNKNTLFQMHKLHLRNINPNRKFLSLIHTEAKSPNKPISMNSTNTRITQLLHPVIHQSMVW